MQSNEVNKRVTRDSLISANIKAEDLSVLFRLFSQKADKITQFFSGAKIITKDDIIDLLKKITEKLKLHNTTASTISITVGLEHNKYLTFGDIRKFNADISEEGETIENIALKIDFLLSSPHNPEKPPQRYALNIRLTGSVSPLVSFQALLSKDPTELEDDISFMSPSCIVSIDFVDALMSNELIQIIKVWHKSLRFPIIEGKFSEWIKKHYDIISSIARYFCYVIGVIVCLLLLFRYKFSIVATMENYKQVSLHLFVFTIIMWVSRSIGIKIETKFKKIIRKIGEIPTFQITKGDKVAVDKIAQQNANSRAKLIFHSILEFIVGFLASLLVWGLTRSG